VKSKSEVAHCIEDIWLVCSQSTIQQIMLHCVSAVKHKLQCKVGYFDLYGFDFMIDEDMKVLSNLL